MDPLDRIDQIIEIVHRPHAVIGKAAPFTWLGITAGRRPSGAVPG